MFTEIFNYFLHNYSSLIEEMKTTNHNYNKETINPYHLEGDIYTHTMMVVSQALVLTNSLDILLAALFHDLGKTKTALFNEEKQRVSFNNHEQVSTTLAIDILYDIKSHFPEANFSVLTVLSIINYHSDFHKIGFYNDKGEFELSKKEYEWVNAKYSKNKSLYYKVITMSIADTYGRICYDSNNTLLASKINYFQNFIFKNKEMDNNENENKSECIILIGFPNSGKSTMVKELLLNKNYVVLSTDNAIMEKYPHLSYNDAYKLVNRDKEVEIIVHSVNGENVVNEKLMKEKGFFEKEGVWYVNEFELLEKSLFIRTQQLAKDGIDVIIDRTNLSQKSRRRWLSIFSSKKYKKIAFLFLTRYNTLMERNKVRSLSGKFISEHTYQILSSVFKIPDYGEGFDNIYVVEESI